MELTGELKDHVNQSKDRDEARSIIENAGMRLSDEELDSVVGGLAVSAKHSAKRWKGGHADYGATYNQWDQIETQNILLKDDFAKEREKKEERRKQGYVV